MLEDAIKTGKNLYMLKNLKRNRKMVTITTLIISNKRYDYIKETVFFFD
jgi:hypothetical protein